MITTIVTLAYIGIGVSLAAIIAYQTRDKIWPPDLMGVIALTTLWPAVVLLAFLEVQYR